jgi:hypothetical protein
VTPPSLRYRVQRSEPAWQSPRYVKAGAGRGFVALTRATRAWSHRAVREALDRARRATRARAARAKQADLATPAEGRSRSQGAVGPGVSLPRPDPRSPSRHHVMPPVRRRSRRSRQRTQEDQMPASTGDAVGGGRTRYAVARTARSGPVARSRAYRRGSDRSTRSPIEAADTRRPDGGEA